MGLTLTDNQVSLLFIGDGVYSLAPVRSARIMRPSFEEFFGFCLQLSVPLLADSRGLTERGLTNLRPGVTLIPHDDALGRIARSQMVIPF